jgi:hypothetical protein
MDPLVESILINRIFEFVKVESVSLINMVASPEELRNKIG